MLLVRFLIAFVGFFIVGNAIAGPLDFLLPKTFCFIHHLNTPTTTVFEDSNSQQVRLTEQQCREANEHSQAAEIAALQQQQQQRAAQQARPPVPIIPYKPTYSQKVEADNGAVYAIDLKTARHFASGVEAGVYDQGRIIPMYFDCSGHMGQLGGQMSPVAPRSVGAKLAAIACAEADRHPER